MVINETRAVVIGKGRLGMKCFLLLDLTLVGKFQAQFEGIDWVEEIIYFDCFYLS